MNSPNFVRVVFRHMNLNEAWILLDPCPSRDLFNPNANPGGINNPWIQAFLANTSDRPVHFR